MNVTRGWSTDFGRRKFSVMVEECDLVRLLAARGVDDPVKLAAVMPARDAYLVMDAEAMMFVHDALAKQEPDQKKEHLAKAAEYAVERNRILDEHAPRKPAE